jgi:hypothetical protein
MLNVTQQVRQTHKGVLVHPMFLGHDGPAWSGPGDQAQTTLAHVVVNARQHPIVSG